jgi:Flp pilus assembly CpaF family ATPase
MIYSAVNIIIQIKRFPDGGRKISEISLLQKNDGNLYEIIPVFKYDIEKNSFVKLISSEKGRC